jgi:hypothetical protein
MNRFQDGNARLTEVDFRGEIGALHEPHRHIAMGEREPLQQEAAHVGDALVVGAPAHAAQDARAHDNDNAMDSQRRLSSSCFAHLTNSTNTQFGGHQQSGRGAC